MEYWHSCIRVYIFIKWWWDQETDKNGYQKELCCHGIYIPSNEYQQRYDDHSKVENNDWPDGLSHPFMDYIENKTNTGETMVRV